MFLELLGRPAVSRSAPLPWTRTLRSSSRSRRTAARPRWPTVERSMDASVNPRCSRPVAGQVCRLRGQRPMDDKQLLCLERCGSCGGLIPSVPPHTRALPLCWSRWRAGTRPQRALCCVQPNRSCGPSLASSMGPGLGRGTVHYTVELPEAGDHRRSTTLPRAACERATIRRRQRELTVGRAYQTTRRQASYARSLRRSRR
jgi:hypothetical protein